MGKTLDRQKGNITMLYKPSLYLQGLGKKRKDRQAVPMSSLVLGGCRDQADLTIA